MPECGRSDHQDRGVALNARLDAALMAGRQGQDPRGRTPLHAAASRVNGAKDAKSLLAGRADFTVRDRAGQMPLHLAAERGRMEVVAALLDARASCTEVDERRRTPLHLAAYRGHAEVVKDLVRSAAIDATDHGGHAPLLLAARHGHFSAALALVHGGASVNSVDGNGRTALHEAATASHSHVLELLLEARAAPGAKDQWRRTPLHEASRAGGLQGVRYLLAYGASANDRAPGFSGPVTPKTEAKLFKRDEVLAELENPRRLCPGKLPSAAGGGVFEKLSNFFGQPSDKACADVQPQEEEDVVSRGAPEA